MLGMVVELFNITNHRQYHDKNNTKPDGCNSTSIVQPFYIFL